VGLAAPSSSLESEFYKVIAKIVSRNSEARRRCHSIDVADGFPRSYACTRCRR